MRYTDRTRFQPTRLQSRPREPRHSSADRLVAFDYLEYVVCKSAVRLAMGVIDSVSGRRIGKAEDLSGRLVVPVPDEGHAVLALNGNIPGVRVRHLLARQALGMLMDVEEARHCGTARVPDLSQDCTSARPIRTPMLLGRSDSSCSETTASDATFDVT